MQLRAGTVSIDTGTNHIIGSAEADWSQAIEGSSWFTLIGDTQTVFTIQTLTAPASSASGFWEATLSGDYTGLTVAGVSYLIHKDFTAEWHLPLFSPGDAERNRLWNRAMWIIDANLGGGGGGGGGSGVGGIQPLDNLLIPTLTIPKPRLFSKMGVLDGQDVLEWWLLQNIPPGTGDIATVDDATSRWRKVG